MSLFKHGRYSGYLRPISYIIDLSVIVGLAFLYLKFTTEQASFFAYIILAWILLAVASKFYEVYRYTREVLVITLIIRQLLLFALTVFAFFGFSNEMNPDTWLIVRYILYAFIIITIVKFTIYYFRNVFRQIKFVILVNSKL